MRLSYNLNLEQTQKLIMTPELRQAIQLLQYTSLELKDYLNKEIEENPMLELGNNTQEMENIESLTEEKDVDWKEYIEQYDDISYRPQIDRNQKEHSFESFISYEPSLKENLLTQLNLLDLEEEEYIIGEYIIQNIDDNGYLNMDIEEIAQLTNSNIKQIEKLLELIQSFEPLGVGARNLKECLLIQIKARKEKVNPNLIKLIEEHLEDIGNNRMQKIAKEMGLSLIEIQDICDEIKTLEPKPGRAFHDNKESVRYIIPDASIEYIEGEFVIILNDITGPRLNINNFYRNLIKSSKDENTTEFLTDKLNSALWLIRSIEQRRATIYKVIESILKFQIEFFKEGEKSLVPLTLKDVAEDIDMHESTVSRATNGKYIQTPRGLFELKYFFTTGISSQEGDISSTSIKSILKDIIDKENNKKPYSDQKLSDILKTRGINISRRTVAKYRDEMEIPSSSMRRRY